MLGFFKLNKCKINESKQKNVVIAINGFIFYQLFVR